MSIRSKKQHLSKTAAKRAARLSTREADEQRIRRREVNIQAISALVGAVSALASCGAAYMALSQLNLSRESFQETNSNQGFFTFMVSLNQFCQRQDVASVILGLQVSEPGDTAFYTYSQTGRIKWAGEGSLKEFYTNIFPLYENFYTNALSLNYVMPYEEFESFYFSISPLKDAVLSLRNEVGTHAEPRDAQYVMPIFANIDFGCRLLRTGLQNWYARRKSELKPLVWPNVKIVAPPTIK